VEFNDGSMYRVVSDPPALLRERQVYMHRAASARSGVPYVDPTFADHRARLSGLPLLVWYQYVYQNAGTPEAQADFLCKAIGTLRPNETVMIDIETGGGITDPQDFARRWLAVVEPRLLCLAWVYVPGALAAALPRTFTGDRVVMAPRYSGTASRGAAPTWPHDVHQYTDQGHFPGCTQSGDTSYTALSLETLKARSQTVPVSQNGYTANDRAVITSYTVTKAGRKISLRKGPPGEMLADIVQWFDENIRDIDPGQLDEWGYAERPIRGGTDLSNHASGTAADVDATKWPLGVEATAYLTPAEIAKVNAKLAEYEGCIRWGANYTGRKDPMHFEINRDAATVARVWAKIQAARADKPPVYVTDPVQRTQRAVNLTPVDGIWGDQTERGVNTIREAINNRFPYGVVEAQTRVGATADGSWGPASAAALVQTIRELQAAWSAKVDGQWGPNTEERWTRMRTTYYTALKK
jgi:hypothetical protein